MAICLPTNVNEAEHFYAVNCEVPDGAEWVVVEGVAPLCLPVVEILIKVDGKAVPG